MDTVSELRAEAPQATASEGLAQGPYMEARALFEPATPRTKDVQSTTEPPHPTNIRGIATITKSKGIFLMCSF